MENNLELKMYCLTLYQFSGIVAGIQCGHAAIEYGVDYGYNELYREWAENWKTFIFLNGGTSETLAKHIDFLCDINLDYSIFIEPDLYNQITAVSFIIDERVFNKEKYPDMYFSSDLNSNTEEKERYKEWSKSVGGERNVRLREWFNLNKFKLAGS